MASVEGDNKKEKKEIRERIRKAVGKVAILPIDQTFHSEFGKNTLEYDYIMEQCQHLTIGNKNWTDPAFPPKQSSLSLNFERLSPQTQKDWSKINWKRPAEFLMEDKIALFDVIEPNDIKQGLLGDCYLLCSLSALAEQNHLIERLFHTKEKQKYGVYSVWLNISGEWVNVNVDDSIPCIGNNPAFSRGQGNELWVLLLEKAYAKIYSSYEIIEGGNPSYALRDLTGAPCENKDNLTANEFWKYLEENDNQKNVLTCYTKQTDIREEENKLGILSGHAYAILDHQMVRGNDNQLHKIVKIRNPWGKKEWTGNWSDSSTMWNPMLKQKLKVVEANDGIFWISIEDFAKYFEGIGNCKVRSNYKYNSIKLDFTNPIQLAEFTVEEFTHGFISVNQPDERMFTASKQQYAYSYCRMFVLKREKNNHYTYIGAAYDITRNMFIEASFQPGSYSENPISFRYMMGVDALELLKIAFKCVAIESVSRKEQKHVSYVDPQMDWNYPLVSKRYGVQYGSFYIYYKNGEAAQIHQESLHLTLKGYIPIAPYNPDQQLKKSDCDHPYEMDINIIIPADREAVILFDCVGQEYSYKFKPTTTFYSSLTKEAKQQKIDESTLLKIEKAKIAVKANISSFGRSQVFGSTLGSSIAMSSNIAVTGTADTPVQLASTEKEEAIANESKDIPEIEQEFLTFYVDNVATWITSWGPLVNWLTFLMFPLFFMQTFAKIPFLDVMIAMAMVTLISSESLSAIYLRKIVISLYISIVSDIIFVIQANHSHQVASGQSLTRGLYIFSFISILVGILFKLFAAFSFLHVWKNFLANIPYIYQGFRVRRKLDEATIARFTSNGTVNNNNQAHNLDVENRMAH